MTVLDVPPEQLAALRRTKPAPGGFIDTIIRKTPDVMPTTDLDRAAREYASGTSPFAELQSYLLDQPVFDRDPRTQASSLPTLRSLDRPEYEQEALAQQYQELLESQRAAEELQRQERDQAIADLRTAIAEQTATAAEAAAGERSALSAALEGRIQEAREAAAAEVADQGTIIGDLKERIGSLTQDLGGISQTIQEEQNKLSEEMRQSQAGAVDLIQGRIDNLNEGLASVSRAVETETAAQSEALRGERDQLVGDLETRIGTLKDQIENLPLSEIQTQIEGITQQSQNFADTARTERQQLEEDLRAAIEGRASAEDIANLRGDYEATGRLVEEALQTGQKQRESLQERVQSLQAAQLDPEQLAQQRATAIQTAVDPIAAQIEQLRGEIPQQIDVEALRKQITDDIMGRMPTVPAVDPNVSAGVGAGGVPYTGPSTGANVAATMNVSDGVADQMGYFEEPERNIYGAMPTTEGAAQIGATPSSGGADIAASAAPATTQAAAPAMPSTQDLIARQRALQQATLGGNFPSVPGQRVLREGSDVLFAPAFSMNQFGEGGV